MTTNQEKFIRSNVNRMKSSELAKGTGLSVEKIEAWMKANNVVSERKLSFQKKVLVPVKKGCFDVNDKNYFL